MNQTVTLLAAALVAVALDAALIAYLRRRNRLSLAATRPIGRLQAASLAPWGFGFALGVYLATRLIGLEDFPIYFFTDEAVQTLLASDYVQNGFRDNNGLA